jgi:hypothetical protein
MDIHISILAKSRVAIGAFCPRRAGVARNHDSADLFCNIGSVRANRTGRQLLLDAMQQ